MATTPAWLEEPDIYLFCTGKQLDPVSCSVVPAVSGQSRVHRSGYNAQSFFDSNRDRVDNLYQHGTPLAIPALIGDCHWVLYTVLPKKKSYRLERTDNISDLGTSPDLEQDIKNQLSKEKQTSSRFTSSYIPTHKTSFLTSHNRGASYCGYVVSMSALVHRLDYEPREKEVVKEKLQHLYDHAQGTTDDRFYQLWRTLRQDLRTKETDMIKEDLKKYLGINMSQDILEKPVTTCMSWCKTLLSNKQNTVTAGK